MSERAVFLDRDNTLIENEGYLGDPAKVRLLPGAAAAMVALRSLGYRLIVVSNQSGVARGLFTEADVETVNNEVSRQLRDKGGAYLDANYYCPYHPEAPLPEFRADHDWRKPKPGMLLQAAADFHLDLKQCWMVGDQGRDIAAGVAAGCRTILLRNPELKSADGADDTFSAAPNYVVGTLADAARIIAREGHSPPPAPIAAPEEAQAEPEAEAAAPPEEEPPAAPPEEVTPAQVVEPEKPPEPPAMVLTPVGETVPPAVPAVGERKPGPAPISTLEQHLDELVVQLRLQNRNAYLRPDFSFSNMAALILQAFAIVSLIIGLAKYFTAPATFNGAQDTQFAILTQLAALLWVMAAVFVQGVVMALLVYARHKQGN
jgi:D,D-heptose 1,7-bisphosphate phosphatase